MDGSPTLYWLLNYSIPEFNYSQTLEKVSSYGKILIASRQLWSLMGGTAVRSCLIGPGVVKGVLTIKGMPSEFTERIGALIFDPTELRADEPTPLIDIIRPEVIDPTATAKLEAIEKTIIKVLVRKGKVLAPRKLAEHFPPTSIPRVTLEEEDIVKVKISHISGLMKAKFVLGGQNRAIYDPLIDFIQVRDQQEYEDIRILRADKKQFTTFSTDDLSSWMIVEKLQGTVLEGPPNTYKQMVEEFDDTISFILSHKDSFIF